RMVGFVGGKRTPLPVRARRGRGRRRRQGRGRVAVVGRHDGPWPFRKWSICYGPAPHVSMFSLISAPCLPINRRPIATPCHVSRDPPSHMSDTGESDVRALAELRDRIDTIDQEMHRLLIERGAVIDALIRTKGTARPGAAFRPGREATMMRRFVARHKGALPLATVEHIWREIITTFTHMQAPFDVAVDTSFAPEAMRDLARFVFGFSVALQPAASPAAVIAAVAGANSLGLIARDAEGAWWRGLVGEGAPRIMALLPFMEAR